MPRHAAQSLLQVRLLFGLVLGLLCSTALSACNSGPSTAQEPGPTSTPATLPANATLIRVIDGDTIDATVRGTEERIRLIGIDTPETKKPNTPVQCFGPEATAYTKSLLPAGTALYVERDLVARDDYGRLLAYVYRADDAVFVNFEIIRNGYARLLEIPPNLAHHIDFEEGNKAARTLDLGLWKGCAG